MDHLFSEYCAECLLSIVEFTQYENEIKDEFKDIDFKDDDDIIIELPQKMVKSKIVYDGDDYKVMAMNLYTKYIPMAAELEININYTDRNKYLQLFEGENNITDDKQELFILCSESKII